MECFSYCAIFTASQVPILCWFKCLQRYDAGKNYDATIPDLPAVATTLRWWYELTELPAVAATLRCRYELTDVRYKELHPEDDSYV